MCFIDCFDYTQKKRGQLTSPTRIQKWMFILYVLYKVSFLFHRHEGLMFDNNYIYLSIQFSI